MNTTSKYLIGSAVGAVIGLFIGQVVVEYIHMKEEEFDYDGSDEFGPKTETKPIVVKETKMRKAGKVQAHKNYDKLYETRPDIVEFIKKYNGGEEPTQELIDNDIITSDEMNELILDHVHDEIVEGLKEELNQEIQIITMDDYATEEEFEHVTLNYYQDDIVTDERDVPVDRPERFLGDDALVSFDDNGMVYVRNTKKKAVYEIIQKEENYAVPTSRRGPAAKSKTRKVDGNDEVNNSLEG